MLAITLLTAFAQYLFKLGANRLPELIPNAPLWAGFAIYGIAWIGFMKALKHGELSVLYPFIALSFVWVALISWRFFGEAITILKITGIAAIVAGISLSGFRDRRLGATKGSMSESA